MVLIAIITSTEERIMSHVLFEAFLQRLWRDNISGDDKDHTKCRGWSCGNYFQYWCRVSEMQNVCSDDVSVTEIKIVQVPPIYRVKTFESVKAKCCCKRGTASGRIQDHARAVRPIRCLD